jgi:DNA-binding YbaB/EbfC family protein
MFDKMKQLYEMQKQARQLQAQLGEMKVEKTNSDGTLKLTVNGTQKVENLSIDPSWLDPNKKTALEKALRQLMNDAFAEIQKQTAAQAATLMKGLENLKIPGM